MSEGATTEPVRKDFRSSYYYKSLNGYKGGERGLGHLEVILGMEVLDLEKLRVFCLQYTLPVYCRPLVWKVLLGILPVYTDKDTTMYVEKQKEQQYIDLRHALQVMGKIPSPHQLDQLTERPESVISSSEEPYLSEQFVLIHLMETHKLLSASQNQLTKPAQVRLRVIAEAFLSIFDEEQVFVRYWLFSKFACYSLNAVLPHLDKMVCGCLDLLASEDQLLYSHLATIGAIGHALPLTLSLQRWFSECFAGVLPESCLESVWDRVVGGSCAVMMCVGVAIILSVKRKVLGLTSNHDLTIVLQTIPRENFTAIVSKGLTLWEAQSSPLTPN